MVALDHGRRPLHRDALDDVGIERPLRQKTHVRDVPGRLFEDPDELAPDDLPFPFGAAHPFQPGEETLRRVHNLEWDPEAFLERGSDPLGLVLPEHPVVDEDAVKAVPDGPVNQHGGDRRVHPAGGSADHLPLADLSPNGGDRPLRVRARRPTAPGAAYLEREIPQDVGAVLGMDDLRMELHPVEPADRVLEGGDARLPGPRGAAESLGQGVHQITMARPGPEPFRHPLKEPSVPVVFEFRRAIGAAGRRTHIATALACQELHPVAHPQHRDRGRENPVRSRRSPGPIDALGPPGEHHPDGIARPDFRIRRRARQDLAVHPQFAEPPGDQLRVLRAEIKDEE